MCACHLQGGQKDGDTSAVFFYPAFNHDLDLMCRSEPVNIMMEHISFNGGLNDVSV
jgi:hypothetical protein